MKEDKLLLGKYTVEIRNHYMAYRTARYMIDHPGKSHGIARRAARLAWRRKALRSMEKRV